MLPQSQACFEIRAAGKSELSTKYLTVGYELHSHVCYRGSCLSREGLHDWVVMGDPGAKIGAIAKCRAGARCCRCSPETRANGKVGCALLPSAHVPVCAETGGCHICAFFSSTGGGWIGCNGLLECSTAEQSRHASVITLRIHERLTT